MERGTGRHSETLESALAHASLRSDISDHLSAIFYHASETNPKLIVELGTRGGESTRILLAVASIFDSLVLSVDLEDCSGIPVPHAERWHFVCGDDVAFGSEKFERWCEDRGIRPEADVIFVDTSHLYEHTKEELAVWSKRLAANGVLMFHDTNMGSGIYARCDGSVAFGYDNQRGVIRAIEEFLDRRYDESTFFVDHARNYLVRHYPSCNGLTIMRRLEGRSS